MSRVTDNGIGNGPQKKQVVLLVPTFRRAPILAQTLAAMAAMDTGCVDWELIVIDNAGDAASEQVCRSFQDRLPLRYLVCTTPGKNAALNHGLREAAGELLVFTDDDVLPESGWLREMWQGACRWPDHVLFGGRVLPHWPAEPPAFVSNPRWDRWTYGVYNPDFPEGPSPSSFPLGANMAVRRRVFQSGVAFNERIGPNGHNYAMGSETDLIVRLIREDWQPVFLPRSLVHHMIRPEEMNHDWLVRRAFRQGRGEVRLGFPHISWYSVARFAKQALWKSGAYYGALVRGGRANAFPKRMACSLARGRLYEAMRRKLERQ